MNLRKLYKENMFTRDTISPFVNKFYYDGDRRRQYLVRFAVLLLLSTVIATYGVISDSVATVIGAMIIAPLMTPIMAIATALVMGRLDRAFFSAITVSIGVVGSVIIAKIITDVHIGFVDVETNSQIMSRVTPNITDLYVAIASGAVAAFAMSRDDIIDSLPGAAIAIALVPPLAVVGVCLSVESYGEAFGAFLLFLTNFFSIIIAGSIVLHLLGLSRVVTRRLMRGDRGKLRKAYGAIIIGMLLVAVPLFITSQRLARSVIVYNDVQEVVEMWVNETDYRLRDIRVDQDSVFVIIAGDGEVLEFDILVDEIRNIMGNTVVVEVEAVQSQHLEN